VYPLYFYVYRSPSGECLTGSQYSRDSAPTLSKSGSSHTTPIDAIKTEYHPHSGRPPCLENFENYRERIVLTDTTHFSADPWRPFQSKLDFEFAELALEASLSKRQVEKMISIILRTQSGEDRFNIHSHRQLSEAWDQASALLTPVSQVAIVLPVYTELNLYGHV
jgi:hypothetical protein